MALSNYKPTPAPGQQNEGIMSRIPWWGWVAGVGVIVVLFLVMRSGSNNNTTTQPGATSDNTQALSDLESSLQQLLAQSGSNSSGLGGGGAGDGLTSTGGTNPNAGSVATDPFAGYNPGGPEQTVISPASPAATGVASGFGPSTRTAWTPPPQSQNPTSELIRTSPITAPAPAPALNNPTPAQQAIAPTPSQSGSAQATMQSHIAVYQNIVASGGTLTPAQAAALKTDIATYQAQFGVLSSVSQPVKLTDIGGNTQGEVLAPSIIQGGNLPAGQAGLAAARLKHIGYSTSVVSGSGAATASKTTNVPYVQTIAGGKKVT